MDSSLSSLRFGEDRFGLRQVELTRDCIIVLVLSSRLKTYHEDHGKNINLAKDIKNISQE
jgi:hypothetical protein